MVIKLVQTDSVDSFKITLSIGEHSFGRGKLLGCEDKRISRNHGQFDVHEDHILMKALHQNPCFYLKNGTQDKQILKKDSVISLTNGDRLGLLPDMFWYEVLYCTSLDKPSQENETEEANTEEYCAEQNITESEKSGMEETINEDGQTGSPPLAAPVSEDTVEDVIKTTTPQNQDNTDCESETEIRNSNCNEQNKSNEAVKRTHSVDETDDSKKIKTEPIEDGAASVEVKTGPAEVKTEPGDVKTELKDPKPGPSADQPDNNAAVNNNMPGPANANRPWRERCMYGAICYRRNPAHFAQFSHPSDPDWGAGRAPCPYGGGCRKRDPRHQRDYYHPEGYVPPPPMGMRLFERYGNLYYIDGAAQVNFYDDRFVVVDSEGDSVDHDYEF